MSVTASQITSNSTVCKEDIKSPHYYIDLWEVTNNMENVFMSWRHHGTRQHASIEPYAAYAYRDNGTTVISHEYLDPEDLIRVCLHDDLAQFHMSLDYMGDMIKCKQGPWGLCTNPLYQNSMEIIFSQHPNSSGLIATKFCTCHVQYFVMIRQLRIKLRYIQNSIEFWVMGDKSFAKRTPGIFRQHLLNVQFPIYIRSNLLWAIQFLAIRSLQNLFRTKATTAQLFYFISCDKLQRHHGNISSTRCIHGISRS